MDKLCRICRAPLGKTLLKLENVPAAAQFMPATKEELAADTPVDLDIRCCSRCGVVQHTAEPVGYFREVVRASGISEAMYKFRLEQFTEFLEQNSLKGKRIFEAGCGRGEYLQVMRDAGADTTGVEYSSENVNSCRSNNLNVVQEYFETGTEKISKEPFDGFFVLNFLEHIPDIPSFLAGIANNLKPGAPGIVEVPNFDMILENGLLTEFSTEHIYYFTAENLRTVLENNGFEVVDIRVVWHDYIISAVVKKRTPADLSDFAARGESISSGLRSFVSRHRKTLFWGAGHQALTVLALAKMSTSEITSVIDSSPDKQGRFTFVTHIPIVSPEILASTDADAVVVACGGYSDEVINFIRSNYGSRFALAVLREYGVQEIC